MAMWIKDENGNPLKVKAVFKSKNLFNVKSLTFNWNKNYVTVNPDGSLTVNAYNVGSKESLSYYAPELKADTTYTLSLKIDSDSPYIYLKGTKRKWTSGKSLVLTQADLDTDFNFYGSDSIYTKPLPTPTTIWDIMINEGTTALPYEKFLPLTKFKAIPKSRNLIPYPYEDKAIDKYGIKMTGNGDGTITIKGTSTGYSNFYITRELNLVDGKTYTLSSGLLKGALLIFAYYDENGVMQYKYAETFTSKIDWKSTYQFYGLYVQVNSGQTVDGVLKPMFNDGDLIPYEYPQEIWK